MKKPKLDQVRTMMKKVWFYDLEILQKDQLINWEQRAKDRSS